MASSVKPLPFGIDALIAAGDCAARHQASIWTVLRPGPLVMWASPPPRSGARLSLTTTGANFGRCRHNNGRWQALLAGLAPNIAEERCRSGISKPVGERRPTLLK